MLSDPWSFLLLREAFLGRRTFAEFRDRLGIATDVLSARLAGLVEHGVLRKVAYREPGQRTRFAYALTPAGEELKLVLIALQQWGEEHVPIGEPLGVVPLARESRRRVRAVLVDENEERVDHGDVEFTRVAPASPKGGERERLVQGHPDGGVSEAG
ncbi:winged helix-turn-helix transcriptional regulator [Streptomyces profundus]|uniref:winged helix-turn-helix transcriptional regulator n=1 Tax=Streptomyces profundus TaxID=2867410 RepID=UPI001D169E16|nr:helix-turn-helix domain-containing protein [Streptomyces sp. MA3_2.13]UED87616.1 helix-turn-helix transcriptional regulator [Streptomyces sp. MA3_2.13]